MAIQHFEKHSILQDTNTMLNRLDCPNNLTLLHQINATAKKLKMQNMQNISSSLYRTRQYSDKRKTEQNLGIKYSKIKSILIL